MPASNQSNENYNSPKIYDTIADTGVSYPNQCASSAPPPPAPPLPTSIFSASSAPAPPAPPPPSTPSCQQPAPSQPSYISEIAKFQANKLKKVESEANTAAKSNGPPGPLDFLAEIRQRIEKKNSMEKEHKNASDNNIDTTSCKPSSLVSRNLNGKNQFAGVVNGLKSQQFESPKTIKKITSTPNVATNGNGTNGAYSSDSINYDKLKQELIVEFRKELQTFKQDIVNTILNELRR
ncbi:enabled -like protein [Brachionus plicatilis]|uniref:Enabled-like protein n=1 Tax=Brachionus plicatilis TaxID=10195 RepID=A0A3M7S6G8_BRAPC|nr:enabled -like protein [Brachionus plicatilis]